MKALQIMTWYSCCYNNERTLNILEEVAFDDPDNTSLFFIQLDIQLLSVNLDQQALLSFRSFFFHYFIIYTYIYIFFFIPPPTIMLAHIILLISLQTLMSVLSILTTAVGIMPLVQIQRDCSTALVILDSAGMDTTVQVWEFFKVWLLSRFSE